MRRLVIVWFVVGCAMSVTPSGVWAQDWEVKQNNREQKIIDRLFKILEGDPFNDYAFKQLIRRAPTAGGLDAVISRYAEKLARDPENVTTLLLLGRLHGQNGEVEAALGYLNEAERLGTQSWRVYMLRGVLLSDAGQGEAARADLETALELASRKDDKIEILRALSSAARREQKDDEAVAYLKQIAELAPRDRYLRWELGGIFYDQEDWEAALEQYEEAARLAGRNVQERARAWMEVAGLQEKLGRYDEAISTYDEILSLTKDSNWMNKEARERLVDVYRTAGRLEALLERLDKRLKRRKRDAWALSLKGRLLVEMGREEEALPVYERYVSLHKKDVAVFGDYIRVLKSLGKHEAVVNAYRLAMKRAPDERQVDFLLDLVRYLQRSSEIPLEAYTVLAEFEEQFDTPEALERIFEAYVMLGSSEDVMRRAERVLGRAIDADPARIDTHLLRVRFELQRAPESAGAWESSEPNALEQALDAMLELEGFGAAEVGQVVETLEGSAQFALASRFVDRAWARYPDDLEILYLRAQRLEPATQLAESLASWRRLVLESQLEAHVRDASSHYVELLETYGLTSAVLERERRQYALHPEDWRRGRLVFFLSLATGEMDAGLEMLEALEPLMSTQVQLEEDAIHLLRFRNPEQAIALLERMIRKTPRLAWRYQLRAADLLVDAGRNDEALERVEEALESGHAIADAHHQAGEVYVRLKRFEEAQRAFEEAIERSPTVSTYHYALAKTLSRLASASRGAPESSALSRRAYAAGLESLRLLAEKEQVDEIYQMLRYEASTLGYSDDRLRRDLEDVAETAIQREVATRIRALE